jgi:riboflavin kinase/FMN adenylyltransferase
VEAPKLVPADGVYAAQVRVGSTPYSAALSIGTKPTVQNDGPRTIEALLVNFEGDLYCETLTVDCTRYLRPQEKFASLEELKQAIARDVAAIG